MLEYSTIDFTQRARGPAAFEALMIFSGSKFCTSERYSFVMNAFTAGGMSFLSKFIIMLTKFSFLSHCLISFQSNFAGVLEMSAITGSRAILTWLGA
jgi:hypothetical protein